MPHSSLIPLARPVRAFTALLAVIALILGLVALTGATAQAAVGDRFKYYGGSVSGSVRLAAPNAGTYTARTYELQGQSGATSTSGNYSIDFSGTSPSSNNDYVQTEWAAPLLSDAAVAARGRIEWILKHSYPAVTTTVLREAIRATDTSFPTGYFSESEAVAGTQAAIWHLTDGVELDLVNTSPNTNRVKKLYQWLLDGSAGAEATTAEAPRAEVVSEGGRTEFALAPGDLAGPFTVVSSTPVTLALSGDAARIIDAAGTVLNGEVADGEVFFVEPTATPALDGAATITVTGRNTSTTVVNAAQGKRNVAPYDARETLAQLATTTQRAASTVALSWTVDRSSAGSFDPEGAATARAYAYYAPGELSATLERVTFTDGTSTETDLIGLQGVGDTRSADVYSADFAATTAAEAGGWRGPALDSGAKLSEQDWPAAGAGALTWTLQHSYPELSTAQLTAELDAAGFRDAAAGNVKSWEAIAGAQAAIWQQTDGKTLDTTRYLDPVAVEAASDESGRQIIDFGFAVPVELRAYTVTGASEGSVSYRLQRSADGGASYTDVSSSTTTTVLDGGSQRTVLGASATYGGYADYRLLVTSGTLRADEVRFDGFGVFGAQPAYTYREYANDADVVAVYRYLTQGAAAAQDPASPRVELSAAAAEFVADGAAVGPFTLSGDTAAAVSVSGAEGAAVRAAVAGEDLPELVVSAGTEFWVNPGANAPAELTVTAVGTAVDAVSVRGIAVAGAERPALLQLGIASSRGADELRVSILAPAEPEPEAPSHPAWSADTVYAGGETVSHDGRIFRAQWWTRGDVPGATAWGSWVEIAAAVETAAGAAPAWAATTVYTGGEIVAHGGQLWRAQWWTRNQEPGASSWGPWARAD